MAVIDSLLHELSDWVSNDRKANIQNPLSGKRSHVSLLRKVVADALELRRKLQDLLYAERRVLRCVQVLDAARLDGFSLLTHDGFDKVDVYRLESWHV